MPKELKVTQEDVEGMEAFTKVLEQKIPGWPRRSYNRTALAVLKMKNHGVPPEAAVEILMEVVEATIAGEAHKQQSKTPNAFATGDTRSIEDLVDQGLLVPKEERCPKPECTDDAPCWSCMYEISTARKVPPHQHAFATLTEDSFCLVQNCMLTWPEYEKYRNRKQEG